MLQPDPANPSSAQPLRPSSDADPNHQRPTPIMSAGGNVDIQQELNKLEEMILGSPRVPFSGRTLVDEDQILDQLDLIRLNLPGAFRQANQVLQQKEGLLSEAELYAKELVLNAERQAAQILDELGIVRQAEQMAQKIKAQAQLDCDQSRAQVIADIEQMRQQAQREWESIRQQAMAEQAQIQDDADAYADRVLSHLEHQLSQMLTTVTNGRTQLRQSSAPPAAAPSPASAKNSSARGPAPDAQSRSREPRQKSADKSP